MSDNEDAPQGYFAGVWARVDAYLSIRHPLSRPLNLFLSTLWQKVCAGDLRALSSPSTVVGEETFAKWWLEVSPNFAQYEASAGVPSLVAAARGVVLDVGAGSGNQLPHFTASSITHIYGIEPNAAFAGPLRERVAAAGLEDKYTTIIAGVEDAEAELRAAGVERGGVDTVLCVQVLCSLDEPVAVVRALHEMLRPGGELVFWEHQANERDWLTRQVQGLWNIVWTPVIGRCRLNQPVRKILFEAADWEVVELKAATAPLDLMPRISGRLRKKGGK